EVRGEQHQPPVRPDDLGADLFGEVDGVTLGAGGADVPAPVSGRGRFGVVAAEHRRVGPEPAGGHDDGAGGDLVAVDGGADDPAVVGEEAVDPTAEGELDGVVAFALGGEDVDDAGAERVGDVGAGHLFVTAEDELLVVLDPEVGQPLDGGAGGVGQPADEGRFDLPLVEQHVVL